MELNNYERETIITFNEAEKTAGVYTHNGRLLRQLEQLAKDRPDECQLERVCRDGSAADYIVPKSWIKIRPKRILSEEERERLSEAGKKLAAARLNSEPI